jgi:hypothetical protein
MIAQAAMNSRVEWERICGGVAHRDQHRHAIGFGAVDLGRGRVAGAQPSQQHLIDPVGQLLFIQGGEKRRFDLAAGLLGRHERGQPAAGHDVHHGEGDLAVSGEVGEVVAPYVPWLPHDPLRPRCPDCWFTGWGPCSTRPSAFSTRCMVEAETCTSSRREPRAASLRCDRSIPA